MVGCRRRGGQALGRDRRDRALEGGEAAEGVEHHARLDRALGRAAGPGRQVHDPAQHVDEHARERQRAPARVGRGVDQDQPPLAVPRLGDQGRAVLERGQRRGREVGGGLGQHLAADARVLGRRQAGERPVGVERRQLQGLLPSKGAAQHPVALAQRDGDQLVAARGEPRPREADQDAALLHPGLELGPLAGVDAAGVGHHEERERALGEVVDRALAQVGVGGQRLGEEVALGEERLVGLVAGRAQDAGRAPLPALVQQHDAAHTLRRRQLEPGDAVAHVGRDVELGLAGQALRVERDRHPGEGLAARAVRLDLEAGGGIAGDTLDRHRDVVRLVVGRAQQGGPLGRRGGVGLERPEAGERLAEMVGGHQRAGAVAEAVAEPDRDRVLEVERRQPLGGAGAVDRPGLGAERGERVGGRGRLHQGQRLRPGHGCRRQQDDLAALAPGLLDQLAPDLDALAPARGGGPAVVDREHERPARRGQPGCGIQDRAGERQDEQRRQAEAQEEEPERRAGGRALVAVQAEEEEQRREGHLARGRRRDAEQQPEGGQCCRRHEEPGLREADQA